MMQPWQMSIVPFFRCNSQGVWYSRATMVLTRDELRSLVEANNRSPHQLLGMHPLGDGSGIVVRASLPGAAVDGPETGLDGPVVSQPTRPAAARRMRRVRFMVAT